MLKNLLYICLVVASGCMHSTAQLNYGIQPEHAGYVPARTAVVSCRIYPNGARFKNQPLANVDEQAIKDLCSAFDTFILDGFRDQPFMRGFSPKWVNQYLSEGGHSGHLEQFDSLWAHHEKDCRDCENGPTFYREAIEKRPNWRAWLQILSKDARNADAVLLPLVIYVNQSQKNDHGMLVSKRSAEVNLFLIDTSEGYLLWSGGRQAFASTQMVFSGDVAKTLEPPTWQSLYDRLFTDDIWRDYPGRQFYK